MFASLSTTATSSWFTYYHIIFFKMYHNTIQNRIELLWKAKSLGESRLKVKVLTIILYLVLGVAIPIIFILLLLAAIGILS